MVFFINKYMIVFFELFLEILTSILSSPILPFIAIFCIGNYFLMKYFHIPFDIEQWNNYHSWTNDHYAIIGINILIFLIFLKFSTPKRNKIRRY